MVLFKRYNTVSEEELNKLVSGGMGTRKKGGVKEIRPTRNSCMGFRLNGVVFRYYLEVALNFHDRRFEA